MMILKHLSQEEKQDGVKYNEEQFNKSKDEMFLIFKGTYCNKYMADK